MIRTYVNSRTGEPYEVEELDEIEGKALVDEMARKYLGMSADEFARRWEANEIPDPDRSEVITVAMLLPFMNQSPNGGKNGV